MVLKKLCSGSWKMHKKKNFSGLRLYWHKESPFFTARKKFAESIGSRSFKLFQSNGPSQVIYGILKSLNAQPDNQKLASRCNWIVSSNLKELLSEWDFNQFKIPVLLGPNIEFEHYLTEIESLEKKYVLVPSSWVKPIVQSRLNIPMDLIKVWASGVDTQYWKNRKRIRRNVLIYQKYDKSDDSILVCNYLRERNIPIRLLSTGNIDKKNSRNIWGAQSLVSGLRDPRVKEWLYFRHGLWMCQHLSGEKIFILTSQQHTPIPVLQPRI